MLKKVHCFFYYVIVKGHKPLGRDISTRISCCLTVEELMKGQGKINEGFF